jgi:CelD/BcsL family acetyltransferase involved in cellulose biosynthesis
LFQIAGAWSRILAGIDRPEFFQRYEWYDALLAAWPAVAADTFFKIAYRGDTPVGIFPLHSQQASHTGLRIRTLATPDPNDVAYPDFICQPSDRTSLFAELLKELRAERGVAWDLLALPRTYASAEEAAELAANAGVFVHQRDVCYYFPTDQGMDAITAKVSSGLRKHLRWCRRQLNGLGSFEVVTTRDPQSLPAMLERFLTLEASGWKGAQGEGTAIKLDAALVAFYTGLMARFGATGECEINLLRVQDRDIAGQFCLISGGTWYHLKIAYDESFDKYSPGSVLLEDVLTRLCADENIQVANYLTGAPWAERWHAHELGVYRVAARNRTMVGRAALQEIKLRRTVRERLIPLLERIRKH